ncbi:Arsenical resistance operon repressor protein [Halorhabdus tiamatea SARL4B]|uniref:Arsenical resistance operon repressor protein n=1 Tax=Halorhabdus tiamatea SARL4B TaxID=1033806 RepID=F7PJG8_9EURY|nr:metalloregulator ArsR/SmtB family transcription factor [Halorhabdus tiamatea]ERJ05789.1 Arsenical resistance operon repressor protein [Halorhabdus tiamatea SARL4B]CCQ34276.1 transcriptional regulator, ArsR family [Halorhabdus tiamatea SARL4B]
MSSQSKDYRVDRETMADLESIVEGSDLETAVDIFEALSDERRVTVMRLLGESDLCVCDLVEIFDIEYSKLSYHLKVLKDAGLVSTDRDGNYVTYQPTACGKDVIDVIQQFE